ncbi:MAG: hypothetical protein ACPGTU_07460 [Myxococcota bacterium]
MELPRVLRKRVSHDTHGIVELCPDEYNLDTLSAQIEAALEACEELALGPSGAIKSTSNEQ